MRAVCSVRYSGLFDVLDSILYQASKTVSLQIMCQEWLLGVHSDKYDHSQCDSLAKY